ncbi:hypothetical protein EPUS_03350 [Endocarpon pusillum Z07020]|uniref:Uncharacterized protein n=1 Tax=Endocarpon pusillum (strain Z07020 / HMAS-L-300199) TaxID=1263415 RepID=U1HPS9_ENDPU|nr:uncharacterized protein EPUS_03350 [Endocarpon pusillum Z07020]ERF71069.1 hypothetical protein EPUS_03350 [Endocarpon pusillum Z07020]
MSIFSKLRRAKQAADSQKEKNNAAAETKPKPAPYKHIPTHAASDALLGAPAGRREEDRKAILAQHQRRSQYNLSRNPSSLSNVTTLNRDQSFTSRDFVHGGTNQRKTGSRDFGSASNVPRMGHLTSPGTPTASSLRSQLQPRERSSGKTIMRRSRIDAIDPPPPMPNMTGHRPVRAYPNAASPTKDVKFHLPSSRGNSPSHSSEEGSVLSSRDSSFCEPNAATAIPTRHPRRPLTWESSGHNFVDPSYRQPPHPHRSSNRTVREAPRLSAVSTTPGPYPSLNPTTHRVENDLGFINFGLDSKDMGFPVAAH